MTTRFVRRSNKMGVITASVAITLSLFGLAGLTSSALNRTGHGQKDPAPVSYEDGRHVLRTRCLHTGGDDPRDQLQAGL